MKRNYCALVNSIFFCLFSTYHSRSFGFCYFPLHYQNFKSLVLRRHTVNFFSEIGQAKHFSGKNIFCSVNVYKSRGKRILKSYIGLSSCHLTSTGRQAHSSGINGAVQLSPQKDNVRFQRFFLPQCFHYSQSKISFFQKHVLPIPFLSQNSRCVV